MSITYSVCMATMKEAVYSFPFYIIPDEEIIPRHLAADDIRELIQVVD